MKRPPRTLLWVGGWAAGLTALSAPDPALATWQRTSQLIYNTAYTLPQGDFEIGLLSPLQWGIADGLQFSLHPMLLFVGSPNAALRWTVVDRSEAALALNVSYLASFLGEEDLDGRPKSGSRPCEPCGFPNRAQATATLSVPFGKQWLVSAGPGVGVDFLIHTDQTASQDAVLLEVHASAQWLITPEQLLMFHASGYVDLGRGELVEPLGQIVYALACGRMHLGLGLAVGAFPLAQTIDQLEHWYVYPFLDIWWRS
jgi:hypothetical protein